MWWAEPETQRLKKTFNVIQVDGSPFIIKWDEKNGWGLFQASALGVSQELCTIVVYCYCFSEENSICFNVELERASQLRTEKYFSIQNVTALMLYPGGVDLGCGTKWSSG